LRASLEVADIFRAEGAGYRAVQAGHLSLAQLKVMSAIENCRTAALGGHVDACNDCGYVTVAYNSCRNRHCPKCQGAAARAWLAEREADLLPVGFFHVVFTLPAEIADIAWQNKAVVYDLLFQAASETMMTIAADPKHLGARIGITAVLHTWGSAMTHHPHIHMIVPGGGISLDGRRWLSSRPAFLLPVRVLGALFRRLFLTRLIALHQASKLVFFGAQADLADPRRFLRHLAPLRKKRCRVDGDVAIPIPHRPGRAGFPHPVPHERDSLTAAYRWKTLAGGRGWRFRISLKRVHRTALWRSRRDNHFCHILTT
jgi:hypothetical protein